MEHMELIIFLAIGSGFLCIKYSNFLFLNIRAEASPLPVILFF